MQALECQLRAASLSDFNPAEQQQQRGCMLDSFCVRQWYATAACCTCALFASCSSTTVEPTPSAHACSKHVSNPVLKICPHFFCCGLNNFRCGQGTQQVASGSAASLAALVHQLCLGNGAMQCLSVPASLQAFCKHFHLSNNHPLPLPRAHAANLPPRVQARSLLRCATAPLAW